MNNRLNIVLLIAFIVLTISSALLYFVFGTNYQLLNIALLLLAVNIVFMLIAISVLNKKQLSGINNLGFANLKPGQLKGLDKVKTIIFSKEKIISTGKYKLINIEHRSTISKKTVLETANYLAKLWKPAYAKALKKKLKEPPKELNYQLIEKTEYGISVTNNDGRKLMLGYYPYVHQYVYKDDDSSFYLIKNNTFSGKFTIREKLNKEAVEQIRKFNSLGNLVYLDAALENEQSEALPFDKAYTGLDVDKQKETIKKLSSKASTALVTTNERLLDIANFDFFIVDKKDKTDKVIQLKLSELHKIKILFELIKKVQNQYSYALYFLLIIDIAAFISTLIVYL
jgi:hypothetical protein